MHPYQQTFIDTYSKVTFAKLYDCKNALVAVDILNDQILLFFEERDVPLLRILTIGVVIGVLSTLVSKNIMSISYIWE